MRVFWLLPENPIFISPNTPNWVILHYEIKRLALLPKPKDKRNAFVCLKKVARVSYHEKSVSQPSCALICDAENKRPGKPKIREKRAKLTTA